VHTAKAATTPAVRDPSHALQALAEVRGGYDDREAAWSAGMERSDITAFTSVVDRHQTIIA